MQKQTLNNDKHLACPLSNGKCSESHTDFIGLNDWLIFFFFGTQIDWY